MACDPPWDLGSVILELYLLSFLESVRGGGEGSAVTGWTEQEMVERRRRDSWTLCEGKSVARGERIVACIAARGGEWSEGFKKGGGGLK